MDYLHKMRNIYTAIHKNREFTETQSECSNANKYLLKQN